MNELRNYIILFCLIKPIAILTLNEQLKYVLSYQLFLKKEILT